MGTGVIPNMRLCVRIVATVSLLLAVASLVKAQTPDESFDEKLRKAAEAYAKKSQAEEEEQKRLVAAFTAKREAMQKQEEAELRQAEHAFRQRMTSLKMEEAARLRELEAKLKGNEEQLAKAIADLKANMLAKETESERAFAQKRDAFSQEVKAKVAAELAKAEAERERKKQIAMMVAMTYFTGGAALPALAASGATGTATAGAAKASATKAAPAIAGKASAGNAGMSAGAKRFADFLASQPNATHAKTVLPVNANRLGTPSAVGGPTPGVMLDSGRLDPDWLDPAMVLVGEAIQAARGFGTVVASRFGWAKSAPPASTIVGSRSVQMGVPKGAPINAAEMIGGRQYTGHALDRMMGRGVTPSVVENTIKVGERSIGKTAGTLEFFDPKNKVGVVIDGATGRVITVK